MSRDSSGNYTLPLPPVSPNTLIESTWANTTNDDMAIAMTDSLSRSGLGGMLAPLKIADGVALNPSFTFTNEVNSGIYRAGSNDVRWSLGGLDIVRMYDDGLGSRSITVQNDLLVNGVATLAATTLASLTVAGLTDLQAVTVQGAFTSLGIDDNATGTVLALSNSFVTASAPVFEIGISETVAGSNYVYGSGAGSPAGGKARLFAASDYDGINDYYDLQVFGQDFYVTRSNGADALQYDLANSRWDFQANAIATTGEIRGGFVYSGVADSVRGRFWAYGPAGLGTGGEYVLSLASSEAALVPHDFFSLYCFGSFLRLGTNVRTRELEFDPVARYFDFTHHELRTSSLVSGGALAISGNSTLQGALNVSGNTGLQALTCAAITAASVDASGEISSDSGFRGVVTGVGVAAGAGRFEVVTALPGTLDPNTVYFVV